MKKLLLFSILAILSTSSAYAAGYYGGWGRGGGWGYRGYWGGAWIAPAIVGGAIAYDLAYPYPYPYPIYTQPAPVIAPQTMQYWYFCAAANAYYPYVQTCPGGWQSVPATPPK